MRTRIEAAGLSASVPGSTTQTGSSVAPGVAVAAAEVGIVTSRAAANTALHAADTPRVRAANALAASTLPALPMRSGSIPLAELIDLYMAHYAGRDCTRTQRLSWWAAQVGTVALEALTDD